MIGPATLPRLLAGSGVDGPTSLDRHLELHGELTIPKRRGAAELRATIERSGLRGRGGAGFPTATKIGAVEAGPRRRRRVVVANGAEGEPASEKDAGLLALSPHLVLDGVAVSAAAVDADDAIVCVKAGAVEALHALEGAIAERRRTDRLPPSLVEVPGGYLAGEESALVNFLNTGDAVPTFVPPRPFERGVGGRPTLIQNVETLAHLALIARHGADWFRTVGSTDDPGSTLVTIAGAVRDPGLYEIPCGLPLGALVDHVGGCTAPVQAFLVGGYSGSWFSAERGSRLQLGFAAMRARGGTLGPGLVTALAHDVCGLSETARIARYLAEHSAEQCGPCTFGMPALADSLDDLVDLGGEHAGGWARHWSARIAGRGACHHPDGAVRMVTSALGVFAEDVRRHEGREPCLALAAAGGRGSERRVRGAAP